MTLATDARAIAWAGIAAVDPARAVRRVVVRAAGGLRVGRARLPIGREGQLHVIGLGKAAAAMADAARAVAPGSVRGIAAVPGGYPSPASPIACVQGEHPIPGRGSLEAGRTLLEYVRSLAAADAALFLISGGGSAVAEVPPYGVTGTDLAEATRRLLSSGAPIGAMNVIRRHVSRLKGGQLAAECTAGSMATVAISDVVGDAPWEIASGPTVADPTTFTDAVLALRKYRLLPTFPRHVLAYLDRGRRGLEPETPKPGSRVDRATFVLAATNRLALRAASAEARRRGYSPRVAPTPVVGETRDAARQAAWALRRALRRRTPARRPLCLLSGGETTVTLGPRPGKGGRNQEFALVAAEGLAGLPNVGILSLGTDGVDGPTDAAGGWGDGTTLRRAKEIGLDLPAALRRHAAYATLRRLGDLVVTGPTGTNVMDLHVAIAGANPGTAESTALGEGPSSRRTRS